MRSHFRFETRLLTREVNVEYVIGAASGIDPPTTQMAERSADEKRGVKAPNLAERVKEEIQALTHSPKHDKETHGTSDDIDETTPVEEVKGPGVFHRMKEEVEAIVEAIHPKKTESPSRK